MLVKDANYINNQDSQILSTINKGSNGQKSIFGRNVSNTLTSLSKHGVTNGMKRQETSKKVWIERNHVKHIGLNGVIGRDVEEH